MCKIIAFPNKPTSSLSGDKSSSLGPVSKEKAIPVSPQPSPDEQNGLGYKGTGPKGELVKINYEKMEVKDEKIGKK